MMARKYGLSESQEQVLRAHLAGLGIDVISRFENRRRSVATIEKHLDTVYESLSWFDRKFCNFVRRREKKQRSRQLKDAMLRKGPS